MNNLVYTAVLCLLVSCSFFYPKRIIDLHKVLLFEKSEGTLHGKYEKYTLDLFMVDSTFYQEGRVYDLSQDNGFTILYGSVSNQSWPDDRNITRGTLTVFNVRKNRINIRVKIPQQESIPQLNCSVVVLKNSADYIPY